MLGTPRQRVVLKALPLTEQVVMLAGFENGNRSRCTLPRVLGLGSMCRCSEILIRLCLLPYSYRTTLLSVSREKDCQARGLLWVTCSPTLAALARCTCALDSSCSLYLLLSSDAPQYRPHTLELRSSRETCDNASSWSMSEGGCCPIACLPLLHLFFYSSFSNLSMKLLNTQIIASFVTLESL